MTTSYNAAAVVPIAPTENRTTEWLDRLADYSPAVGRTDRGHSEIVITFPADSLRQAISTGRNLLWGVGGYLGPSSFRVLTTEDYDREVDAINAGTVPSLVSVTEAAEIIGVQRQRVHQLIDAGQLRAVRAGSTWAIPRYEVNQIAAARAASKTVDG